MNPDAVKKIREALEAVHRLGAFVRVDNSTWAKIDEAIKTIDAHPQAEANGVCDCGGYDVHGMLVHEEGCDAIPHPSAPVLGREAGALVVALEHVQEKIQYPSDITIEDLVQLSNYVGDVLYAHNNPIQATLHAEKGGQG